MTFIELGTLTWNLRMLQAYTTLVVMTVSVGIFNLLIYYIKLNFDVNCSVLQLSSCLVYVINQYYFG